MAENYQQLMKRKVAEIEVRQKKNKKANMSEAQDAKHSISKLPLPKPSPTPTPWKLHPINGGFFDSEGTKVNILSRVNAAYIVRAVNSYQALLQSAKEEIIDLRCRGFETTVRYNYLMNLIARAEGK